MDLSGPDAFLIIDPAYSDAIYNPLYRALCAKFCFMPTPCRPAFSLTGWMRVLRLTASLLC